MPTGVYLLIGLLIGGVLGLLLGWLYGRGRAVAPDDRLANELRRQLKQREDDLAKVRDQLTEAGNGRATAEEKSSRIPQLETQLTDAQREAQAQTEQNIKLTEKVNSLEEKLAKERQEIATLQHQFQKDFEAVANRLLVENASRFGKQSSETLDKLLGPLRENLQDFKTRLDTVHRHNVEHSALLKDQISHIGVEAANLSKALKGDVKALGNWGENMLDQILDKSGLQLGLHYHRQGSAKDAEGEQRFLDVIVDLPDKKHLVIDCKVSLKYYEEHVNAGEESTREKHLVDHIECIRKHFRDLGSKRYQDIHGINTPDFVLMYIPIEAAFFVAVAHDPSLFSEALERNIVLITNSTLLATLRTVASVWRLADQQKNAMEIADRGGKLYDKFVGFVSDLQEIGVALKRGHDVWEEANKKLHLGPGNLVRQAEQLKALRVKASKSLPAQITAQAEADSVAAQPPADNGQRSPAEGAPVDSSPL